MKSREYSTRLSNPDKLPLPPTGGKPKSGRLRGLQYFAFAVECSCPREELLSRKYIRQLCLCYCAYINIGRISYRKLLDPNRRDRIEGIIVDRR
jgi:hypothetical protein